MEQENRNQQNAAPQVSLGDQIKVRREKLAQLLVQVAGRAGRADRRGEVLLQTAVYAGVPAGNTGMAVTLRVLGELGRMPEAASFAP